MEEEHVYLEFNFTVLKWLGLWPKNQKIITGKWKRIENYICIIVLLPTTLALGYDLFASLAEGEHLVHIVQIALAWTCIVGENYMCICFINNRSKIKRLINRISEFERFSSKEQMIETDKEATFYSKAMVLYSTFGAFIYVLFPLFSLEHCNRNRSEGMIEHGIPCGMVARERLPVPYDYTPMFQVMYGHQVFLVFTISWVIITLTMVLCSVVIHARFHLKRVRQLILEAADANVNEIEAKVDFCIRYHIFIIGFCEDLNDCFGSQMVVHLMLTSFLISILGFIIIMVGTIIEAVRFTLHLFGWMCLLLLVCYFGQTLIDESTGIGNDAFKSKWYRSPITVQKNIKMIIQRSQKPIYLKVLNLGHMSFQTFLKVMKSAYSYFTLLINIM